MDENTSAIVFWTEVSANGIAFLVTTDKMRYCLREMGKISAGSCETIVILLVVWIQANNKPSCLILSKLGANKTLFWLWILEHAFSRVFRFLVQLSFISKERGVFLCTMQTGRAHSQHWFLFPCGCAILLTMKGDRRSSSFEAASSTFSSNWSCAQQRMQTQHTSRAFLLLRRFLGWMQH